jgi:hypothetical protein
MPFFRPIEEDTSVADFYVNGRPEVSYAEVKYPPNMIDYNIRNRDLDNKVLTGPKLKLERARQHIAEVADLWRKYVASKPFEQGQFFNHSGAEVVWMSFGCPPPAQISIVVGDAVHALRSALDWLTCDLVRANGKHPVKNTSYPTQNSAIAGLADLVSPAATTLLTQIRRAKRWNEALWILHNLDIQDKHDRIITTAAATLTVETIVGMPMMSLTANGSLVIGVPPPDSIPFPGIRGRRRNLASIFLSEQKNEIYRFNPHVQENIEIRVDLVFADSAATGEPVLNLLELFAHGIERVLVLTERRLYQSHVERFSTVGLSRSK